jgi:RNA polymerase sigma-70 factor, ECF subfamily
MSDKNLIVELKTGKSHAYDKVFHKYSSRVFAYALRNFNSHAEAEDIVQEVFFSLWKYKHNIDENKNFDSYLFVMSINAIRKRLRERYNEKAAHEGFHLTARTSSNEVIQETEFRSLHENVLKAIDNLPARQKEIYFLSREKGYRNAEIAEKLSISKKTVENQLNRAIKFLKEYLIRNDMLLFF